jgi:hypothetical protein
MYLISAQTNGEIPESSGGGSSGGSGGPPSFGASVASVPSISNPLASNDWEIAQLPPAPPGMSYGEDADGNAITTMAMPTPTSGCHSVNSSSVMVSGGAFSPTGTTDATPEGGPAGGSQGAPPAPVRPSIAPAMGTVGTFGVAYQTYSANGTNGFRVPSVPEGQINGLIQMQEYPADLPLPFGPLAPNKSEANNFISTMQKGAWHCNFLNVDNQVTIPLLSGSGTPFNQVSLGVLLLHGTYGTSVDYTANGCEQMYFPVTSGTSGQYIRMSQMNFGGAGSNGLKWMLIGACYSLHKQNWKSMQAQKVYPYNSNLHFLLGADTLMYSDSVILQDWAKYMLGDPTSYPPEAPEPIQLAWYYAGVEDYGGQNFPSPVTLACAGDNACQNDTLQTNSPPTGTPFYQSSAAY